MRLLRKPTFLGLVEYPGTEMVVGSQYFSRENLNDIVADGGVLFWSYAGHIRVLCDKHLTDMHEYFRCLDILKELDRDTAVPYALPAFTWDQTVSLEEYFKEFGESLDGQAEGDSGG